MMGGVVEGSISIGGVAMRACRVSKSGTWVVIRNLHVGTDQEHVDGA